MSSSSSSSSSTNSSVMKGVMEGFNIRLNTLKAISQTIFPANHLNCTKATLDLMET